MSAIRDFASRVNRKFSDRIRFLIGEDDFSLSPWELERLRHTPRLKQTYASLLGKEIALTDAFWYLHSYRELFLDRIYEFTAHRPDPLIIDCGANIGLSVIYFKYLYPHAKIIAFEPDAQIFQVLERNVRAFGFADVTLHPKAVWISEMGLPFQPDGSVGGRLVANSIAENLVRVQTVHLRDWLDQKVDFLKMDIEGAECEVVRDCRDRLQNVDYLFVEYHGKPEERQILSEMLQVIQDAGLRYYISDACPISHPFEKTERNSTWDLQLNIFGYRNFVQAEEHVTAGCGV